MLKLDNVKIYEDLTDKDLFDKVLRKAKINSTDVIEIKIRKKSIDARDKKNVFYNYSFLVKVKNEKKYNYLKSIEDEKEIKVNKRRNSKYCPIIVGAGPAGLFCALTLVDNGIKPIIIEQGRKVEERILDIENFIKTGKLNERSNVQFGEGGAGTFSDGKLTTGISSPYIKRVLEYFVKFGAPEEILYESLPHIGTDKLRVILKNMRHYIENLGGKYYFGTKLIDFKKENNLIKVICENKEFLTDSLVLAIGHSARDTYKLLQKMNLEMARKNFAVGLRIEHKQEMINKSQYGIYTKLNLPPASYKLVEHLKDRSCFTFCMCPGGEVISSGSEEGTIVTNGMSYYKRNMENANAALLVNVITTDFAGDDVLAGMYFQEELEKKAFVLGGSNYKAPVQRVEDFMKNKASTFVGKVIPSIRSGYTLCNLNEILPQFIADTLKEAIFLMEKKIEGFDNPDAILTGIESRSSAPITILRNEDMEASISGIYPCGEGAGYAGGITSSAIDGIKVANKILEKS